jgi:drug/metabolite transporter (DMT)-like permease
VVRAAGSLTGSGHGLDRLAHARLNACRTRSRLHRDARAAEDADLNRRSWILFGLMGAIWGVPYLFIKVAVEHMSPPVVVFGRSAVTIVPLLIVAVRAGAIRPALVRWRPLLAFAAIEMAIPWLLLTDAERRLPSGLTGLLIACVPIVGAVVAFALGDRAALAPRRVLGIALGLAGVAVLVAADVAGTSSWWSVIEVLLVCICYATAPFIASRQLADVPDVGVVAVSLTAVAVVYAPIAWFSWPEVAPPARAWLAVIALGVLCTAIAFVLFFRLIAAVGPARSTLITFVNPAVAVIVGAAFLDEQITAATIGGFVLILAGCWLATRHEAEVIADVPVVIEPIEPIEPLDPSSR